MTAILRYAWLTLQHKAYVFRAGLWTGAPIWRLLIHDWSKFTPAELPHYGRQFFGSADDAEGFSQAWNHHQKANPHHWEYWQMVSGHTRGGFPDGSWLPMPEWAVREMVADWIGASRAYEGRWPAIGQWAWQDKNLSRILSTIHPTSAARVRAVLIEVGLPAWEFPRASGDAA